MPPMISVILLALARENTFFFKQTHHEFFPDGFRNTTNWSVLFHVFYNNKNIGFYLFLYVLIFLYLSHLSWSKSHFFPLQLWNFFEN